VKPYCILALVGDLKKGKRGAIAKAISIVENDPKEAKKLLKTIFKDSGNSFLICRRNFEFIRILSRV